MRHQQLGDEGLDLKLEFGLPPFGTDGMERYQGLARVALVGRVEQVFYSLHVPGDAASQILNWPKSHG